MQTTNLEIVFTYLTSKPKQTVVAMLGVTFGISMYIFMNSFMNGVNTVQSQMAFVNMAHIHIYNDVPEDNTDLVSRVYPINTVSKIRNPKRIKYTQGIKNTLAIRKLIEDQPSVISVAPEVNISVFFKSSGNNINGTLSGVEVAAEDKLFGISAYMTKGKWSELKYRSDGIFIGSGLAELLSVDIEDNVNILTAFGVTKNFKVIGIFQTNTNSIDKFKAYANIGATRQMLAVNQDYATDLQVNIKDFNETAIVVDRILPVILPYRTESWQTANHNLEAGSKLRDIIALAISFTILLVAGFGIYNIMNMTVSEKIKEIAILKAMGFSGKDVTVIFLAEAVAIGVIGGVVGIVLGFCIAKGVASIPFKLAGLNHMPMSFRVFDYAMAFFFGLLTTLIAGYLPARKAAKIDPVDILRG